METLEKLTFSEYMEREMNKYYKWFYSLSEFEQNEELDRAVRWYEER